MGLLSRLFGRRDALADAERHRLRTDKVIDEAVRRALARPDVRDVLTRLSLGEDALRSLRKRLCALVPERDRADRAIQDVELIEWYFSLSDPNRLSLDDSLQLAVWARYGRKHGQAS